MKKMLCPILFCCFAINAAAQQDVEFPKEFIMHLKLHNGMVTNFTHAPDQYVGGIQLVPQYTLVVNKIRGGIVADAYYTGKKMGAAFGPTVSFKLKSIKAGLFGGAGNIHLDIDHLWGTNKERLFGGGINADILNRIVIGFSAHRDYNLNTWWLQNTVAFRISKLKKGGDL
jgi:hypothetical protein